MSITPIRAGLVSYGMSGSVFHAPYLHTLPQFDFVAVVERGQKRAHHRYPFLKSYASFEYLLASDVELVVVNTPNHLHHEQCKAALLAGKHVVVEKPMTVTSAEADELIALAAERNLHLVVYQNRRWDSDFLTVQRVVNSGLLGRLVSYEAHFDRYRTAVDQNTWKEENGPGGGILYNLGSHMIDQTLVLFGLPTWVYADLRTVRTGGVIHDAYDIELGYAIGLKAVLRSSYLVREQGPRYSVHGEAGSFLKWGLDVQEEKLKAGQLPNVPNFGAEPIEMAGRLHTEHNGVVVNGTVPSSVGNYAAFYEGVAAAIREGREAPVQPQSARDVIRVIELCYRSHDEQRRVAYSARD